MGQLEQKVALYRAWDVLPESLKRAVAQPPPLLENLRTVVKTERDLVLADAWNVLANYVAGWVFISSFIETISRDPGGPDGPPSVLFLIPSDDVKVPNANLYLFLRPFF